MSNQTDNSLIQIFLPVLQAGLIANGFTTTTVIQSNQPTMQGINTNPIVYFFKIGNKRYGFLGTYDKWDADTSTMVHSEAQYFESTWRVSCLALQNVNDITKPTASDIVNDAASIMQSDATRDILNQNGIGILRVTDVSNPYFVDDRDNFEASPSFEFTLVYENIRTGENPVISQFSTGIYGV